MERYLIVAASLSFFSMVIVYQAFLTAASSLSAVSVSFTLTELNLWFMILTTAGVFWFGCRFRQVPKGRFLSHLWRVLGANALSVAALALGAGSAEAHPFLLLGGVLYPLTIGWLDGCLHYLLALQTPAVRQGAAIGLYVALTNVLLFAVQTVTEAVTKSPMFLPWPVLLAALAIIAWLFRSYYVEEDGRSPLPQRLEAPSPETAAVDWKEQAAVKSPPDNPGVVAFSAQQGNGLTPRPLVEKHLLLFTAIALFMSLLIGLSSTFDFLRYEEYYKNWHATSRLFLAAGYLLAGWLADRYPVRLPVMALTAKMMVFASYTFVLEGAPLYIEVFADAFFNPCLILFLIWMFFRVAPHTRRPQLWAGMGRAIERPVHIVGAFLGELLVLHAVPNSLILLSYVTLLIVSGGLLYRALAVYGMLQGEAEEVSAGAAVSAGATGKQNTMNGANASDSSLNEPFAFSAANQNTNDLAQPMPFEQEAVETETQFTAQPVRPVQSTQPAQMEEIIIEDNSFSAYFATEEAHDETETKGDASVIDLPPDKSYADDKITLPDNEGPLHGDVLRKYQIRYRLTNRETEVLWEILQKHKVAEIAENLVITIPTAKYHISNILSKTGARNQRELRHIFSRLEEGE